MASNPHNSNARHGTFLSRLDAIDRRWIFLAMGLSIALPILLKLRFPEYPGPMAKATFDAIESVLDSEECDEVLRVDAIASGLVDGVPSHVVVEVSSTGDTDDVVRAERRAAILRKAGMVAIPVVACEAISRETALFAQARGVRVWCSGTMLGAAG